MVVFSCSGESASCKNTISSVQSPNLLLERDTTDEPLTRVAEVTHKVWKSIIRMVVMSYIVGIVCLSGKNNCAISCGNQQTVFV